METPVVQSFFHFPAEFEVIAAEARALGKLSPSDRFLALMDHLSSGEQLLRSSPHAEEAMRLQQAQEEEWQRIHQELFHRHGY